MDEILNKAGVEYDYKINPSAPALSGTAESNETEINLVIGQLNMIKSVDKEYATIGDILTYTVVLNNSGNILLTDIIFKDIINSNATFVTGSVTVNGTSQPTYDPNVGFNLGSMLITGTITVTFQATVTSLPSPNTISNQASSTFNYLVILPVEGSATSNTVITTINVTNINVVKSSDVSAARPSDIITYTVEIENNGNIDATNIQFIDAIDSNTTFVSGSVQIDSTPEPTFDPNVGFAIPDINPGNSVTVTFEVSVN